MKHSIVIAFAALYIIGGCAKDQLQNEQSVANQAVDSRGSNKITICHGEDTDCPASCSYPLFDLEELMSYEYAGLIYYDSEEQVCEPSVIEGVLMVNNLMTAYANTANTENGVQTRIGFTRYVSPQVSCELIVGVDITQEQYEAAQQVIREAIAAYSGKLNYCEYLTGGNQPSALVRSGDMLKKMEQALVAHLRQRAGR